MSPIYDTSKLLVEFVKKKTFLMNETHLLSIPFCVTFMFLLLHEFATLTS